jgi:hypothetical protein
MVAIHLNANYIFVAPMQSRSKEEMIRAHKTLMNRMRLAGLGQETHIVQQSLGGLQTIHPRTTDAI